MTDKFGLENLSQSWRLRRKLRFFRYNAWLKFSLNLLCLISYRFWRVEFKSDRRICLALRDLLTQIFKLKTCLSYTFNIFPIFCDILALPSKRYVSLSYFYQKFYDVDTKKCSLSHCEASLTLALFEGQLYFFRWCWNTLTARRRVGQTFPGRSDGSKNLDRLGTVFRQSLCHSKY